MIKRKVFKRSIALLLAVVMMLTIIPFYAAPAEAGTITPWDGTSIDTSWYDPDKTEYDISSAAQLAGLAAIVNNAADGIAIADFYGKTVNLTADLDLGGVYDESEGTWSGPNWQPIGGAGTVAGQGNPSGGEGVFAGTFNGNGHRVANMYLYRWDASKWADAVGLFGKVSGTVRGITVTGYVYSNRSVAGVVGRATTSTRADKTVVGPALVEDCINYAEVTATDSKGVGGVVGAGWASTTVRGCKNYGTITTKYGSGIVGGVVGDLQGNIENSVNYGVVQAIPGTDRGVGGVIGNMSAYGGSSYYMRNCVNYGEVKTAACLGGIMGRRYDGVAMTIENCYNYGKISGGASAVADYSVGGIVGFAGSNQNMLIKNCYNASVVETVQTGKNPYAIVGLITSNGNVNIDNCYFLQSGSLASDPGTETNCKGHGEAKTEAEMKAAAFVTALGKAYTSDFEGGNSISGGYPILFWQDPALAGQTFTVSVDPNISNGSLEVEPAGQEIPYMTQVTMSNTPALGYILDYYTVNGTKIEGNTAYVTGETVIGAVFRLRKEVALTYPDTDVYTVAVNKTSGLVKDGNGNFQQVPEGSPAPVTSGDKVYEEDVLTVAASLKENATPPADTALEYSGAFNITVENTTRTGNVSQGYQYTVSAAGPVEVGIEALTQNKNWSTLADTSWYKDEDTEFTLTTAAELAGLAKLVSDSANDFSGKTVKLGNDISLKDTVTAGVIRQWSPIGNFSRYFAGTFDGQGHKITDFILFNANAIRTALFGSVDGGTVKNVTVEGGESSLTNNSDTAIIVGYANNATIQNCINKASLTGTTAYGDMGGVVGSTDGTTVIEGCANYGTIQCETTGIGGVVGNLVNTAKIRNSFNAGNVSNTQAGSRGTGGVAGTLSGIMENCYNSGTISAINTYAGGVAAQVNNAAAKMSNCYNTGKVINNHTNASARLGGLAGNLSNGSISNSYSTGKVTKGENFVSPNVGAAVGQANARASLSNIGYLDTSCEYGVAGGTDPNAAARTAAEMKNKAFVTVLGSAYLQDKTGGDALNNGYPILYWQHEIGSQSFPVSVSGNIENGSITAQVTLGATPTDLTENPVTVPYRTPVTLTNTPAATGYILDSYTVNGKPVQLEDGLLYVTGETVIGANFRTLKEPVITFADTDTYTVSVKKNGLIKTNGEWQTVTDHAVNSGDTVYETDVLTVTASLKSDAPAPEDTALEYSGTVTLDVSGTSVSGGAFVVGNTETVNVGATADTQAKQWSTLADTSWYDNNPSAAEFTLTTGAQLAGLAKIIADKTTAFSEKTVKLGDNISLLDPLVEGANREWTVSIGSSTADSFHGVFDGQGHTISGLLISPTGNSLGLFKYLSGEGTVIKNLNVAGKVTGNQTTGAIVANLSNAAVLENCTADVEINCEANSLAIAGGLVGQLTGDAVIRNCVNNGVVTGTTWLGGIVGRVNGANARIENCVNNGKVTGTDGVGGIAGFIETHPAAIDGCVNNGDVNTTGSDYGTGGIAGSTVGPVQNSYNTGKITSKDDNIGGLVGIMSNVQAILKDSYNTGDIVATSVSASAAVGGLVGNMNPGTVSGCYNTGSISLDTGFVSTLVGGAIGNYSEISTITNCYYEETTSDYAAAGGSHDKITAMSAADMKKAAFVSALNGEEGSAFVMDNRNINNGYPIFEKQIVENVIKKIEAIGTVTLESESLIAAARAAYDALDGEQAKLITNYQTLTAAEAAYELLKAGQVSRIAGGNRFETSAKTALQAYPNGAETVIIARGDDQGNFADALAASYLAGVEKAPILLVSPGSLPQEIENAVKELKAKKAYVLGGELAVSEAVASKLKTLVLQVERITGQNRYATAAAIAAKGGPAETAIVVSGFAPADSLVAGPLAFGEKHPILLVDKNSVPAGTKKAITDLGIKNIIVIGGENAVSKAVYNELKAKERYAGRSRIETSLDVAEKSFATAKDFSIVGYLKLADAVGAAVSGHPIIYVKNDISDVDDYLTGAVQSSTRFTIFGGPLAVSNTVDKELKELLK